MGYDAKVGVTRAAALFARYGRHNANKHGLILRLIGNRIAFSPPVIICAAEVKEMSRRLRSALDDTWSALRAN